MPPKEVPDVKVDFKLSTESFEPNVVRLEIGGKYVMQFFVDNSGEIVFHRVNYSPEMEFPLSSENDRFDSDRKNPFKVIKEVKEFRMR